MARNYVILRKDVFVEIFQGNVRPDVLIPNMVELTND